jgi:uncharacterized membrane protein
MALKDTIATMKNMLSVLSKDIEKATNGNKAASQRVRTGTIKLEKVAKLYRKESVATEKKAPKKRKAATKAPAKVKKAVKKAAPKKKVAARRATAKVARGKKKR